MADCSGPICWKSLLNTGPDTDLPGLNIVAEMFRLDRSNIGGQAGFFHAFEFEEPISADHLQRLLIGP